MTVNAMVPEYTGVVRDAQENFHGNQLLYVGWDGHLMFCSAFTFMVPPSTLFKNIYGELIVDAFSQHPEWDQINWNSVEWSLNGKTFTPNPEATLEEQGVNHKSLLRFKTPELKGYKGTGV